MEENLQTGDPEWRAQGDPGWQDNVVPISFHPAYQEADEELSDSGSYQPGVVYGVILPTNDGYTVAIATYNPLEGTYFNPQDIVDSIKLYGDSSLPKSLEDLPTESIDRIVQDIKAMKGLTDIVEGIEELLGGAKGEYQNSSYELQNYDGPTLVNENSNNYSDSNEYVERTEGTKAVAMPDSATVIIDPRETIANQGIIYAIPGVVLQHKDADLVQETQLLQPIIPPYEAEIDLKANNFELNQKLDMDKKFRDAA